MRIDKVILRAALTTLASIAALCAVMILALCLVFPSTMMQMTYELGMNGASISFAQTAYDRTDNIHYIAFATEVAILDGDMQGVVTCGNKLLSDNEFESYCQNRNQNKPQNAKGTYQQYFYGQVCAAEYNTATSIGVKMNAVDKAYASLGEDAFPENNALAAVLLAALHKQDTQTIEKIKGKMNEIDKNALSPEDGEYYDGVFALLQG
jgi:hypothetical protein